MSSNLFLSQEEEKQVVEAIRLAEQQTSGEIRVHIESACSGNVLDRAAWLFKSLKMDKTDQRNGVLIYLSVKDRKFAIIGDAGINAVVPAGFWDEARDLMISHFSKGELVEGFILGIEKAGQKLKEFFPHRKDDLNELSNEISFGK